MTSLRFVAILCIAPVALAGAPRAAYAEDVATRTAKRHFERGEKLYALGKFDEALDEYQKAYDAKPIAAFLFNIGQCHRGLGDYDSAIFSYKKYLREAPDADNREKVEALIADLEDKQAKGEAHRLGIDHPNHPPPARDDGSDGDGTSSTAVRVHAHAEAEQPAGPVYRKWWFWTGVALVGVAAGVGIYAASHSSGGAPGTDLGNIGVPPP